ncbi:MAG: hypothetical protein PF487_05405, partial [Bacteroidales bacterium]|nr:hypothetical protein [Bacteroidales bacterium]
MNIKEHYKLLGLSFIIKFIFIIALFFIHDVVNAQILLKKQEIQLFDFNNNLFFTSSELGNDNPFIIGKY